MFFLNQTAKEQIFLGSLKRFRHNLLLYCTFLVIKPQKQSGFK